MIRRWFRSHVVNFGAALGRIGATPFGAALNILVVAIALALPAGMHVLIANLGNMSPAFEDVDDFTIYLKDDIDEERGRSLSDEIALRDDVESTQFISRLQAMADFRDFSGLAGALDALTDNPLPQSIRVSPSVQAIDAIDALAAELGALEETESVALDRAWMERLLAILALGERVVNVVTVLLAAAVILVIGNTIRLEINNRRTEIEVLKLVGATDGFIRRPFLYTGFFLGTMGAMAAALMITIGLMFLAGPVRELAGLYASDFRLRSLPLAGLGVLLGGGALLGWAGAWISAARHLKAIEPA